MLYLVIEFRQEHYLPDNKGDLRDLGIFLEKRNSATVSLDCLNGGMHKDSITGSFITGSKHNLIRKQ